MNAASSNRIDLAFRSFFSCLPTWCQLMQPSYANFWSAHMPEYSRTRTAVNYHLGNRDHVSLAHTCAGLQPQKENVMICSCPKKTTKGSAPSQLPPFLRTAKLLNVQNW
eukprot:TRINITY_DN3928_c0_g2_i1.p2 TRINITY_DN3928_c0_g2~~TRINITY_DN3928_c0_g2_i1.p2  ORF type:complete len:109 (-),score=3.80 TRINITY_DN3928_c0_g2_i1:747-1073(-)